jgi:hypothetical protein
VNQTGASGFRDDFSYAYFRRLVAAMQGQYRPCLFGEAPARLGREGRPLLFLRHDVDVSLERALEMARVEQDVGIAATYLVLAKAALYDYRSAPNARLVRELRRCGHEVGLHFDIEAEGVTQDAPAEEIERVLVSARDELAEVLGESVPSFSFHRPIPRFLRGPLVIAEMVNGYAAELMAEYISDSKAHWREGEPLPRFSGKPKAEIFQVLVHPIWWGEKHQSGAERLQSFFEEQTVGKTPDAKAAYADVLARAVPAVARAGADAISHS